MSTHNICFRPKIKKNVYPCKPQFYHIRVGCKAVYITQIFEPRHEKTGFLHMRKQRRRSASR